MSAETRPLRPASAPCRICRKPQPQCQHQGCYRTYRDGHRSVTVKTEVRDGYRTSSTSCDDCGAGFGSMCTPLDWPAVSTPEPHAVAASLGDLDGVEVRYEH